MTYVAYLGSKYGEERSHTWEVGAYDRCLNFGHGPETGSHVGPCREVYISMKRC